MPEGNNFVLDDDGGSNSYMSLINPGGKEIAFYIDGTKVGHINAASGFING